MQNMIDQIISMATTSFHVQHYQIIQYRAISLALTHLTVCSICSKGVESTFA